MTDKTDDETSGIPERAERADSGGHFTDSGRHVNRNVVSRTPPDTPPVSDDSFDVVTPVRPQPVGMFDVPTPPRHAHGAHGAPDAPDAPDAFNVPTRPRHDVFEAITPRRTQPRGVFGDDDPIARPHADATDAADVAEPDEPPPPPPPSVRTGERWPRLVLGDEPAAEAAAAANVMPDRPDPPERRRRATPEPRRASTEPGYVEPRRRPTTPPPSMRAAAPAVHERGEPVPARRAPTERGPRAGVAGAEANEVAEVTDVIATGGEVPVLLDRALRFATALAVFGLGAAGLAQPTSVLRGGIAWLAFLFFVLTGWGAIVARIARTSVPDAGLRAALGAAGYVAVAGVLLAAGVLSRPVILALACIGYAGFTWREATAPDAIWHRIRDGLRFVARNPALGVLVITLGLLAIVRMLGAVAALDRNPWDDDVAYTPLVKRLLDTGNLVEPFSFRRLAAYGGQTVLQALGAARGSLANLHLIDKGLAFGVALLVLLGHARERRTQALWLALIALVVVVLPDSAHPTASWLDGPMPSASNTASYWTGLAAFLALYRLVVREQWALVGLVAAMTATLRQNFLVVVAVFLACVLVARLVALARAMPLGEAWLSERRAWGRALGTALAVIAPWCVAAYLSSGSFLFPIFDGNWNHELSFRPAVTTWPQELEFLLNCCVDTAPIVVVPILALVVAFVVDRRPGRPLTALVIASAFGFALLVHGLVGSEAQHAWRYAFGFATALAIVLVLELGADDERVTLAPLGRWLVLAALVLQLLAGRGALPRHGIALLADVREAAAVDRRGDPSMRAEQRRYRAMQAALPPGARAVVMVDDPWLLDFRSHALANLDTPGFASPGSQLPAFGGAEPLRAYLVAQGYRYAAFVRSDRSRYAFRRGFWLHRMFIDSELFQIMSAYMIDAIDSFAELATTTRVLYDDDGLVVLDLGSPRRDASQRASGGPEPVRRSAWVRELADREGLHDAWSLITRADLRFEDGTDALRFVDGSIDDPRWYEVMHPRPEPARRGTAVLPTYRRVHLRVRGATDMHLALRAAVALNTVYTRPRLDVSLDGELLASAVADAGGHYAIDATVPRDRLAGGWHDLYLVFSSIADPGKDVRDLRIARLESVEWSPQ